MALNLGRTRNDIAGSQDSLLNSIKLEKTALPKFTGKNAAELNALAQFIEDKFAKSSSYSKDLTSANTDASLERIHEALLKLKEASDADDTAQYDQLKSDIISQIKELMTSDGKGDVSETELTEEDKQSLSDIIKRLFDDDKNPIVEKLKEFLQDNTPDMKSVLDDANKGAKTKFIQFQKFLGKQMNSLNKKVNIVGSSIKNSELFKIKNPLTGLSNKLMAPLKAVQNSVGKLGKKIKKKKADLKAKMANIPIVGKFFGPKDKKAEKEKKKKENKIGKFMEKIMNVFKNIGQLILQVFDTIIIGFCKILAKGIGVILKAIFLNPFGLIILASLLLISVGILLISLAVKKLVDYIVDDLGPIIKEKLKMINPETLNNFIEKVTFFIDTFTSIIAGIFAPIIAIGKLIMAVINPVAKVIGKIAEVLANILVPIIEFIGQMIKVIIKPVLLAIKAVILGIVKIITALLQPFFMLIDLVVSIITKLLVPIIKVVMQILMPIVKIIGKVVELIWAIVKPIFDIITGVILGILEVFKAIFDEIVPIITEVVGVIIKGAVLLIKEGIAFVGKIIKSIWNFLCHPIDFIMGIVKGIGNWLAGFADKEIGVWRFKFKPFGFLKGLKTESNDDEPIKIDDGKAQEIIDDLNNRLNELKKKYANIEVEYKGAQDQIKLLNDQLKEAMSVKIDKNDILFMVNGIRRIRNWLHSYIKEFRDTKKEIFKKLGSGAGSMMLVKALWNIGGIIKDGFSKLADSVKESSSYIVDKLGNGGFGLGMLVKAISKVGSIIKDGFILLKDFMKPVVDYVGQKPGQALSQVLDSLISMFGTVGDMLKSVRDSIVNFMSVMKTMLKEVFADISSSITRIREIQTSIDLLKESVESINIRIAKLTVYVTDFIAAMKYILQKISYDIAEIIVNAIGKSIEFIKATIDKVNEAIVSLAEKILSIVEVIKQSAIDIAERIKSSLSSMFDNLKNDFSEVLNVVKASVQQVSDAVKSDIMSVSSQIKADVLDVAANIDNNIQIGLDKIYKAVKNQAYAINDKKTSMLEKMKSNFGQFFSRIKDSNLMQSAKSIVDKGLGIKLTPESMKNMFSSLKNVVDTGKDNIKNLVQGFESQEENHKKESDDIPNTDIKTYLMSMLEAINANFDMISKKLDTPQLIPVPSPMNIQNQALIGAN